MWWHYICIGVFTLFLIGKTTIGWTIAVFLIAFGLGLGIGGDGDA